MIGLISQNNILKSSILEILKDFEIEIYTPKNKYTVFLTTDITDVPLDKTIPLITIGCSLPQEALHIQTPIHPYELIQKIETFLTNLQNQKKFENNCFIFKPTHRCLTIKKTNQIIQLTEKENDLLTSLMEVYPNPLSREKLLERVWNYKPDTETHTVESHIYSLRQKIGPQADSLFQSTPHGYILTE